MNLESLGNLAEIVGVPAVVVALKIFILTNIRHVGQYLGK